MIDAHGRKITRLARAKRPTYILWDGDEEVMRVTADTKEQALAVLEAHAPDAPVEEAPPEDPAPAVPKHIADIL